MARRCVCERLLDMVGRDPRLVAAGLAARMAFVELMRLAERIGTPGVIAFGSGIRNLDEVSLALGVRETELQTAVETLVERGVLKREGEALVCLPLREAGRKAAAARANGGLGGRPRKGESAEAARARRQGNLLLPVAGGKPTETETRTLSRAAAATTASSSELSKQASESREETEWTALGRRVVEAAGIDEASWLGGYADVRGWLALGLDAEEILAVVARVASRDGYRPARSLRYFTPAMREAAEAGRSAPRPRGGADWTQHPAFAAWRDACDAFRANPYGAPPVMPAELAAARAAA